MQIYGKQFHLHDVTYQSFITRRGALIVSANDVVTAITALLESAAPDKDSNTDPSLLPELLRKARQRHFWMAYDALTNSSTAAEGTFSHINWLVRQTDSFYLFSETDHGHS